MLMHCTTMGLVVRETKVGESDRLVTILTDKLGVIQASARGAHNLKNKLFSATGLFCYSEFTLYTQRSSYSIDEAALSQNFYGLRNSVEGLAAATYIAEVLQLLRPESPQESQELLRLSLNSLYLLSQGRGDIRQIKAVFELRAVSESGYRPDLLGCYICNVFEHQDGFWMHLLGGRLYCARCCHQVQQQPNLPPSVVTAMRHAVYSDIKKVFSFQLKPAAAEIFYDIAQQYLWLQLDRQPKTLEFLQTVLQPGAAGTVPQPPAANQPSDPTGKEEKIDTQNL